jgi:hypothetical protein
MNAPQHLRVRVDRIERLLMFDYDPANADALFDICDEEGHILKTGDITGPVTQVRLMDVFGDKLILMVLDGDNSTVRPIELSKAS